MRKPWVDLGVTAVLGAAAGLSVTAGPVWLVGVWVALAYVAGRYLEARQWLKLEKLRARASLEAFSAWAERTLASAPEELEPDQEELRSRLQADYQAAQSALEKLR